MCKFHLNTADITKFRYEFVFNNINKISSSKKFFKFLVCNINLTCPEKSNINVTFNCSIAVISNRDIFDVLIDFNDTDRRTFSINDSSIQVLKNYTNLASTYLISVRILGTDFEYNSSINSNFIS